MKAALAMLRLAQTLWGFGAVAALTPSAAPERPMACSAALWRAARALDVRSTLDVTLCTFFHAKLMYEELVGARGSDAESCVTMDDYCAASDDLDGDHLATIAFPSWIDAVAKEAWIKNAVDDVDVSGTHLLVAECLRTVLPTMEVVLECLTADECFSLDVYVPALDLGVEVDGPTHYAEASASSSARCRSDRMKSTARRACGTAAPWRRPRHTRVPLRRIVLPEAFPLGASEECAPRMARSTSVGAFLRWSWATEFLYPIHLLGNHVRRNISRESSCDGRGHLFAPED